MRAAQDVRPWASTSSISALLADGDLDSSDLVLMPRPFRDDTSILYLPSVLYKC